MNTIVVSYSMTGNNQALAKSVAKGLRARHVTVSEPKKRTIGKILLDLLFHRTPKVAPSVDILTGSDAVLLVGPIWSGEIATPLRAYMKSLQKMSCPYAFLSISGGADGPNVKLADGLRRRMKREPVALIDLHIADLLPSEPKPKRKDTSVYQLSAEDVDRLTAQALQQLEGFAGKEHVK